MPPILEVRNLSKRYGTVRALKEVSASFSAGEVHALLGENGAGKSTLVSALAGFVIPDTGSIEFTDRPFPYGQPFLAKGMGIQMVHQHFMLVPSFTVEKNLALALVEQLWSKLDVRDMTRPALALAAELGWDLKPDQRVDSLPVGIQQRVEIIKALAVLKQYGKPNQSILILDEPTAVLTQDEVSDLFRVLRTLKESGYAIILIAHKLSEVMAIADQVTVLRKGEWIASTKISETNPRQLAERMVGKLPSVTSPPQTSQGETVIQVANLSIQGDRGTILRDVRFDISRGQVLGFAGVDGNGQVELAETLAGIRPSSVKESLPSKIAYIPQDRQQDGLALSMSIFDNLLITGHRRPNLRRFGLISSPMAKEWAQSLISRFEIKIGSLSDPVSSLSGGNQQKIVVSRSLDELPDLIIAVNPTRGLDVRATEFVHQQLISCAESGSAVALFSTDLDELAALSHKIVTLTNGTLVHEFSEQAIGGIVS